MKRSQASVQPPNFSLTSFSAKALLSALTIAGGLGMTMQGAIAQTSPNISYDSNTGAVRVNNNAFDIKTGAFDNAADIPLPSGLPTVTRESLSQPTNPLLRSPNSIEITPDVNYINESLNSILSPTAAGTTYQIQTDSLKLTTQFDLNRSEGNHSFGEGIEATVYAPDGSVLTRESGFVRGDRVTLGTDGNPLPEQRQITVNYGENDKVELRVLNLATDNAQPSESGIYFSADGQFVVEDLPNGGDLDFNDGEYVRVLGGKGEAITLGELQEISFDEVILEAPLDPELRQEESVETDVVRSLTAANEVSREERDRGEVDLSDTATTTRLGHATGAQTADDEQLVYNRYSRAAQVRLGTDGLSATGQLSPLINNPKAPPTLLTGNATFDPTVGDNEAGFTTTVGVTQFLNRTHRAATDMFGNAITDPNGSMLVEPTGLFNNQKWVGYVPSAPDQMVMGEQLFSTNGVFEVPEGQAVEILPADLNAVGRGNAAYVSNVGGLIVEDMSGALSFVPQWTESGFATEPTVLEADTARRIIYALVPQQPGQSLQIGDRYAVTTGTNGYTIADGGFTIISADQQPQNFVQEMAEVYAVEDTLPSGNAVTDVFNGVQGVYIEQPGGDRIPTVDVGLVDQADARVGNSLFPINVVESAPGQLGYAKTTRAAGFYVGAALTGGVGNQQDSVRRVTSTVQQATDEMRVRQTVNTFETPLIQQESVLLQNTTTTQNQGMAFFNINSQGELSNVNFVEGESTTSTNSAELERSRDVVRGEEFLASSTTSETRTLLNRDLIERDKETTSHTDSYANLSSVQGELALGGVFNFGNTPWTQAANTVRAELFARDTVLGRSSGGGETGWRTELVFHPFGEVQRSAHQYDAEGNAVPMYQTAATVDASGRQLLRYVVDAAGETVAVPVNQFLLDDEGQRIAQTVGTGEAKGPGVYLRAQDVLDDNESVLIAGGIQFSF
ncbi:MAG: hypothetical protein WBA76_00025 [Phormidesmis sp.]